MKTRIISVMITLLLAVVLVTACSGNNSSGQGNGDAATGSAADSATGQTDDRAESPLEDGIYLASFKTDNSMFHVNEAKDGKGVLTVENGQMTIHVSLASQKILNLFPGLAEDAKNAEESALLAPSVDTVTYSDGMQEEVFGFDIPVPYLDEEFDCALVGEKGKWYDHKVSVSDPVPCDESADSQTNGPSQADRHGEDEMSSAADSQANSQPGEQLADGTYHVKAELQGGSGKAYIESPVELRVSGGMSIAVIVWSSEHYDYMIVDGETYYPVNTEGNSVFEIPVNIYDRKTDVQADTTAMSQPHLIDYTIEFFPESITG